MTWRTSAAVVAAGLVAAATLVYAQEPFFGGRRFQVPSGEENVEYDGRMVFVRLRYDTGSTGGFGRRSRDPGWAHDYPTADIHLMKIVDELTIASPRTDGSNILALDDPELFRYPIAYLSEPGAWDMSDKEAASLRSYLLKGGFIIFDDFRGGDWYNLEEQMRLALPEHHFIQLDATTPIFHSFFEIDSLDILSSYGGVMPTYYGIFEDNDPRKRLMAIANRDGDLGEYWEFSDTGMDPVDLSNEAYKFGVNYMIYGMTH